MAIYRAPRPTTHYTTIRNDVIRDERLSFRAAGILATILSHTDNWSTSTESLVLRGKEGRDAIRTALAELEAAGYLVRQRRQDDRGRWSTQAVVYDEPQEAVAESVQEELFSQVTPETDSQASVSQSSETRPSVSQAVKTEHPSQNTTPTESAAGQPVGHAVAVAVYERSGKSLNFMGMRTIATKFIRQGHSPELVMATMTGLWDAGRAITNATVGRALQGAVPVGGSANTHADHWSSGRGFIQENGT